MGSAHPATVLIAEDEPAQMELLRYNLEKEGYRVLTAPDGEEALELVRDEVPDLVLLDWMMPNLSGIELCRRLRRNSETRRIPIMMLTARGEESDRIRGLDIGADDYLVKPYSVRELLARVRALLRRNARAMEGEMLSHGGLVVDLDAHRARLDDRDVQLGPTEFRLLLTLLERPGKVWSRDQLLDRVWGRYSDTETRTVDVHVGRLRKALRKASDREMIRTVRGFGYALDGEA